MNKAYSLNHLVSQPVSQVRSQSIRSDRGNSQSEPSNSQCAWLLIGIPGSGKSTFAHRLQRSHSRSQIICPDRIRTWLYGSASIQGEWSEIWQEVKAQFVQAYDSQHSVIYDATNCQRAHRLEVIELAKASGFKQINGLWLQEPLWICLMRNQRRDRSVPEDVVIDMHRHLQDTPPQLEEGFDSLIYPKESKESEWLD